MFEKWSGTINAINGEKLQINSILSFTEEGFHASSVEGWGFNGSVNFTPKVGKAVSNIERLWAYLTLKQILEQRNQTENKTGLTQKALRLATKYSFLSDVSSLVVGKPNSTNIVELEDGSKNSKYFGI